MIIGSIEQIGFSTVV